MTDKEIFYSMLSREIDNLLAGNPSIGFLSGVVKKWVFRYIDPYVSLFMDGDEMQTEIASAYVKEELSNKINEFKRKFEEEKEVE